MKIPKPLVLQVNMMQIGATYILSITLFVVFRVFFSLNLSVDDPTIHHVIGIGVRIGYIEIAWHIGVYKTPNTLSPES
jgi:hypothetical protein